jgi:hypothetical protein
MLFSVVLLDATTIRRSAVSPETSAPHNPEPDHRSDFFSKTHWFILQSLMVLLALIGAVKVLKAELVSLFGR